MGWQQTVSAICNFSRHLCYLQFFSSLAEARQAISTYSEKFIICFYNSFICLLETSGSQLPPLRTFPLCLSSFGRTYTSILPSSLPWDSFSTSFFIAVRIVLLDLARKVCVVCLFLVQSSSQLPTPDSACFPHFSVYATTNLSLSDSFSTH